MMRKYNWFVLALCLAVALYHKPQPLKLVQKRSYYGPVDTLNNPHYPRSPVQNKRKLTQSEALADQPFRPNRQKEEDSIVLKDLSKVAGGSSFAIKGTCHP